MSTTHVTIELRRHVFERAASRCEYCLIHDADTFVGCSIDHIISEKHGGETSSENLAAACLICNRLKGSDIASVDPETSTIVRLFHPREDRWDDHFRLETVHSVPMTAIGRATARLLRFNSMERLLERQALIALQRWPGK